MRAQSASRALLAPDTPPSAGRPGAAPASRCAHPVRAAVIAAIAATCGLAPAAGRAGAGPDEATVRNGQRLFHAGVAADGGDVEATLFGGDARLSGAATACAGCHGADGRGRTDAGTPTPDIRWEALTRERAAGPGGPARPAYGELTLMRALRSGVDPTGRPLAAAMPRFEFTPRQAAEIVGYLQRVGTARDAAPGVDDQSVHVAIVVRHERETAAHVEAAVACLREANAGEGIYGRRLKWSMHTADSLRDESDWRRLADEAALVLAPAWPEQAQLDRFVRWATREQVLVVGPAGTPTDPVARTTTTFRVAHDPAVGWRAAVELLAARAASNGATTSVVWSVVPDEARVEPAARAALAAERQALREAARHQERLAWHEVMAAGIGRRGAPQAPRPDVVLVMGGAAQVAEVDAALTAARLDAPIVASSAHLGRAAFQLPPSARARLRLVHGHPLGEDFRPQRLLRALESQQQQLTQPALQATAFAAGCLVAEGLRRAGRRLTHDSLRTALESVRDLATGVTMPLTFGPRQRHGVWGARLVRLEGERLVADSPWLTPSTHAP